MSYSNPLDPECECECESDSNFNSSGDARQFPFESEVVSREKDMSASGKFGGVAGVFAGAKTEFSLRLLWAILSDGVGGIV